MPSAAMATSASLSANPNTPSGAPRAPAATEPERLFTCETCQRVFNKKANLKVHSRKHTGEKPYACSKPGCGRAFMWKSSVTFHEQNCQTNKKDSASSSTPSVSKGVAKRPKNVRNSSAVTPAAKTAAYAAVTPSNTNPALSSPTFILRSALPTAHASAHNTTSAALNTHTSSNDQALTCNTPCAQAQASAMAPPPIPTTPMSPEDSHAPAARPYALPPATSDAVSPPAPVSSWPMACPSAMSAPTSSSGSPPSVVSPPPPPSSFASAASGGLPDGAQLPAPATLLVDKRLQMGGRPPIIPASFPKHFYGRQAGHKESAASSKPMFELRVTTPGASGAKPPVMHSGKMPKMMPKMPIAMDLDDSDDEGAVKIVGAQDAFMRTGNPFSGFAPPTRCSPLPASSPIVCPGISPMPLSPLAPFFSPLPPDSPAHNAPNPVHPPVNAPSFNNRTINTNW